MNKWAKPVKNIVRPGSVEMLNILSSTGQIANGFNKILPLMNKPQPKFGKAK